MQVTETIICLGHVCTHQIQDFTLKHGVHSNDEGSGRAQHFQEARRQNRDVWVTENMRGQRRVRAEKRMEK